MDSHRNISIFSATQYRMARKRTSFLPNFHPNIIRLSTFQFSTLFWVGIFNPFRFFHLKLWVVDNRRMMVAYVSGDACHVFGLVGCGPVGELMNFCRWLHSGTFEITIHHEFFYDMTATMSVERINKYCWFYEDELERGISTPPVVLRIEMRNIFQHWKEKY